MIPEPQRAYVLELLTALGAAADGFVLAGAQAMKFYLPQARATRDFDFVLNVLALRENDVAIREILNNLGYSPDPAARNFHFQKSILDSTEVMRIEFMAPDEHKRKSDFRVDIQAGIHARACEGGAIALAESEVFELVGRLPNGQPASAYVRVVRPEVLVMLKCLAMDERYRNLRGGEHAENDRNEAGVHAEDIVAILSAQIEVAAFRERFVRQFENWAELGAKTLQIIENYWRDLVSPGILLYEERLRQRLRPIQIPQEEVQAEIHRAQALVTSLICTQKG